MYKLEKYSSYGIHPHFIYLSRYKVIILPCEVVSLVIDISQGIGYIIKVWHYQAIGISQDIS